LRLTAFFVALAWLSAAGWVQAQELFPRFDFHLDGQYVVSSDPRFNWMFDFGGDVDIVRGDFGRAMFIANYEAGAGEEFRRFDVNQGNYLLEGALLFKVGGLEVGPVWHHVSRHLSDRPKRFPIDWNQITLRVQDASAGGEWETAWHADLRATVTNAFVDYKWEAEAGGNAAYRVSPRVRATAAATGRFVGVDDTRGRGSQFEGRLEAGLRLEGRAAAAELFAGVERRLDPYPVEFSTASWFLVGFRLKSR
jgi:hypothetical protein